MTATTPRIVTFAATSETSREAYCEAFCAALDAAREIVADRPDLAIWPIVAPHVTWHDAYPVGGEACRGFEFVWTTERVAELQRLGFLPPTVPPAVPRARAAGGTALPGPPPG